MATIVVQLGLATIPFGMLSRAPAFTSGTTRGTSGSILHAEELSIDDRAGRRPCGVPLSRGVLARSHQHEVDTRVVGCLGVFYRDIGAFPFEAVPTEREEAMNRI